MVQAKRGCAACRAPGPARARGSRIKIRCSYRKCKSKRDVKNTSKLCTLQIEDIDVAMCRRLRRHCHLVRFCCVSHRQQCLAKGGARGQRECLDAAQVGCLFHALLAMSLPWVAVIMLLQVVAGERGGCMCQARRRWLQNLSPQEACPPTLRIEQVNGKTKAREIPLAPAIAGLFHQWLSKDPPLQGGRWPLLAVRGPGHHRRQRLPLPRLESGRRTERARPCLGPVRVYASIPLQPAVAAADILQRERSVSREKGEAHPFDGYPPGQVRDAQLQAHRSDAHEGRLCFERPSSGPLQALPREHWTRSTTRPPCPGSSSLWGKHSRPSPLTLTRRSPGCMLPAATARSPATSPE